MFRRVLEIYMSRVTDVFVSDGRWRFGALLVNTLFFIFTYLMTGGIADLIRRVFAYFAAGASGWRCALLVFAVILLFLLAAIVFIPCLASLLLQVCGLIAALVGLASPSNAHKTHDAANVVITSGTLVLSVYLFISVFF